MRRAASQVRLSYRVRAFDARTRSMLRQQHDSYLKMESCRATKSLIDIIMIRDYITHTLVLWQRTTSARSRATLAE
jgi:hypothetical protein